MSQVDESKGIKTACKSESSVGVAVCPKFFGQYINKIVTSPPCTTYVISFTLHVVTLCPAFVGHLHD